jgi:hypothetical protein
MPQQSKPKRFVPFHLQSNDAQQLLIKGVCQTITNFDYPQLSVFKNMLLKIGLVVSTEADLEDMAHDLSKDTAGLEKELKVYENTLSANEAMLRTIKESLNSPGKTVQEKLIAIQDILRESTLNQKQEHEERRSTGVTA